uniref:PARG catalytic Macro domain-containing protein n=1 Tax=Helicotheca tamesis TaxID=374047 RepID=A0A7S2IH94_9STRA|mmetsp:Transcript_8870/g.12261  ORF Transcript_8870/g.12261 Transcript_8870/m.12261 type:complete len:474 (+) Transcript_8870:64-1485(+)
MTCPVYNISKNELEQQLPESCFEDEKNVDLALRAFAAALSRDGTYTMNAMYMGLHLVLKSRSIQQPARLLRNIRRWALDGLADEGLSSFLQHLEGPALTPSSQSVAPTSTKSSISVTAKQARCVLANALLSNINDTMAPFKDPWSRGGLDFRRMIGDPPTQKVGLSKVECLLLYFKAGGVLEGTEDDERQIIFERISFAPLQLDQMDQVTLLLNEEESCSKMTKRYVGEGIVLHNQTMESPTRPASAFVNFANSNFGYGHFISSCTQEEILQMCCPEIMVGMLVVGQMLDNEVVNVRGVRRFTKYSGYLSSFLCEGQVEGLEDDTFVQSILTIDACYSQHFSKTMIQRDVSKAFYSFREHRQTSSAKYPVISTGKWGCGAFGGLTAHKMIQQALAATLSNVDLEFSCFGDVEGCDEIIAAMHAHRPTATTVANLLSVCKDKRNFVEDAIAYLSSNSYQKITEVEPSSPISDVV